MGRRKRKRECAREERVYRVGGIGAAFRAAMALWAGPWESPDGPAVVTDVGPTVGGGWVVTCRLVKHWGKEAWS